MITNQNKLGPILGFCCEFAAYEPGSMTYTVSKCTRNVVTEKEVSPCKPLMQTAGCSSSIDCTGTQEDLFTTKRFPELHSSLFQRPDLFLSVISFPFIFPFEKAKFPIIRMPSLLLRFKHMKLGGGQLKDQQPDIQEHSMQQQMPPIRSSDLAPCPHYCGYRGAGPGWVIFELHLIQSLNPAYRQTAQRLANADRHIRPPSAHPGFFFAIYFHIFLIHFI